MSVKTMNGIEQSLVDLANGDYQVTTRRRSSRLSANPESVKAVCVVKDDPALTFGKVYSVKVLVSGRLLVLDNNGESVICDRSDFQMPG